MDEAWRDELMPAHLNFRRIQRCLVPGMAAQVRSLLETGFTLVEVRGPVQMGVATCTLSNEDTTLYIDAERGFSPATLSSGNAKAEYVWAAIAWSRSRGRDGEYNDPEYFPKTLVSRDLSRAGSKYDVQHLATVARSFHERDDDVLGFVVAYMNSKRGVRLRSGVGADRAALRTEFDSAFSKWELRREIPS